MTATTAIILGLGACIIAGSIAFSGLAASILGFVFTHRRWPHALVVWGMFLIVTEGISTAMLLVAVPAFFLQTGIASPVGYIGLALLGLCIPLEVVFFKLFRSESERYGSIDAGLLNLHW